MPKIPIMYYRPVHFIKTLYGLDKNWLLFFANVLFVILSYWIFNALPGFYPAFKAFRIAVLLLSLLNLYLYKTPPKFFVPARYGYVVPVFGLLFIPSIIFAGQPLATAVRLVSILLYIYYLFLFFRRVSEQYPGLQQQLLLIEIFRFCYLIPIAIYFLNRPSLTEINIYGSDKAALGMTSNNFGWAASFYFLLTVDRIKNFPTPGRNRRFIDLLSLPVALYIVFISGSRSSLLALAIAFILLIFFRRNISNLYKSLAVMSILVIYIVVAGMQDLAVNRKRGSASQHGRAKKEVRMLIWKDIYHTMTSDPRILFFGVGPENSKNTLNQYLNRFYKVHPHNTYLILLFEGGLICFSWFLVYFLFLPLARYLRQDITQYSYVVHPFIISFFDHNLGPGQFMAFPLFSLIFLYLFRSELHLPLSVLLERLTSTKELPTG